MSFRECVGTRAVLGMLSALLGGVLAGCGNREMAPAEPLFVLGEVEVIPRPEQVEVDAEAGSFRLSAATRILVDGTDEADLETGGQLQALLRHALPTLGGPSRHAGGAPPAGSILFTGRDADASLGPEGYELMVGGGRALLRASTPAGRFHAMQTLRQLLPPGIESEAPPAGVEWSIPNVRIRDRPRFPWRGLMLDTSRTFLPIDFVRRYVDLLALYKMSVLHLHLSDDQGWRVESERHPELHEVGSVWDAELAPDEVGGFYTKAELRDLVDYAARRYIEIVPEIDMPGHTLAILRSIPELACTTSPDEMRSLDEFRLIPWYEGLQIHPEVLCACDERVYRVLEEILDEIIEIFPSRYVHLGGDETPTEEWEASHLCQARVADGAIPGIDHVQASFSKRMEDYLLSRGRQMIGWTEVLGHEQEAPADLRLSPGFTTMHWLAFLPEPPGLYERDVVQSPAFTFYLDWYATTPLEGVYRYEPVPEGLVPEQAARVIGVQGNMWTGFPQQRTLERIDIHVFPKLLAIAELAWSPHERRDFADFELRRQRQTPRLDLLGVARGSCDDCIF